MQTSEVFRTIRAVARATILFGAAAVIIAFVLGMHREPASSDNIVIKDAKGQKRLEIGIFDDKPAVVMYDRKGRQRLRLGIFIEQDDASQVSLQLHEPDAESFAVELCASYREDRREQSSFLHLDGSHGSGISAVADARPGPRIAMQGDERDGQNSMTLSMAGGVPGLGMMDRHGNNRLVARLSSSDGSPRLYMKDKADKTIWQAPPAADGSKASEPDKEKPKRKKKSEE